MRVAPLFRTVVQIVIPFLLAGSLDGAPQGRGMEARGDRLSLSGKVILADGSGPPDAAQIETICGGQRNVHGKTKSDGGFQFTLGRDPTVAMTSARVSRPGFEGGGGAVSSLGHVDLTNCEVRAVLPGYSSSVVQLGRRSVFESPDIGAILLTPIGQRGDPTVSATTLDAPKKARKSLEKARKELQKEQPKFEKAAQELERAVAGFPAFAEAWYELGEVRLRLNQVDAAKQAFERSIAADGNFQKPYPPLALIELKQNNLAEAARLADKAVGINAGLTEAHFYRAMAHHMLGNGEQAGESAALVLKQGGEQWYPRVLVIVGDVTAQKQDFAGAAQYYARYVELEPDTSTAQQVRQRIEEWKSLGVLK